MTEQIHVRARKFLQEFFNDEDLTNFCFDYFPQVYNDFTNGMPKSQKVRMLVENSQRRGRFDELLAALERERPKSYPDHFAEHPQQIDPKPEPVETTERNPRQIFISHAHQDTEFAQRLAADLQANGWQTWMASDNIRLGEKWVEAINRGLSESGVFALVLTPEAVASRWVQSETNVAIGMEHRGELRLLPLNVKPAGGVPALWGAYQWIPLNGRYKTGLDVLLSELEPAKKQLASTPAKQPKPWQAIMEQIKKIPTRLLFGSGGVILLFLLVWAFWPDADATPVVEPTEVAVVMVAETGADDATETAIKTLTPTIESIAPTPSRTPTPTPTVDPNVPPLNAELGDIWIRPKDEMVMVYVPPPDTPFVLESGIDAPTEGYWIDKYEVSNAQYQLCVAAGACEPAAFVDDDRFNGAEYPVVGVSAFDAEAYSEWVGGALPTEEQWEYAAVGDAGFEYPWGDEFDGVRLNFCDLNCDYDWQAADWDDGYKFTAPVDSFPDGVSWTGAFNMSGNVWEWTASWWDEDENRRVLRGGSWIDLQNSARAASRLNFSPASRSDSGGFRLVVVRRPPSS